MLKEKMESVYQILDNPDKDEILLQKNKAIKSKEFSSGKSSLELLSEINHKLDLLLGNQT